MSSLKVNGQHSNIRLAGELQNIPITLIDAPKDPTRALQSSTVEELGLSIEADGLYSPITVKPTENGRFEVVAGNHRYQAIMQRYTAEREKQLGEYSHKLVPSPTVPCIVRNLNADEGALVSIIENAQRNQYDIDCVKQGEVFSRFLRKGWTVQQITERIGKRRTDFVANRILLFQSLHTTLKSKLLHGHLPFRVAVTLAGYPLKQQMTEYQKLQSKYTQTTFEGCHFACKIHCPKPNKYQRRKT